MISRFNMRWLCRGGSSWEISDGSRAMSRYARSRLSLQFRLTFSTFLTKALGQCASFLRTNLPSAKLIPVASTAQAAHTVHTLSLSLSLPRSPPHGTTDTVPSTDVHSIPDSLRALPGAAICSLELAGTLDGLVVAREGVQDIKGESKHGSSGRTVFKSSRKTGIAILVGAQGAQRS